MEAMEFVVNYENYLNEIEQVIKPEYHSVIEKLRAIDSHDLISPDTWFHTETDARGYVWTMFLKQLKEQK